MSHPLGLQFGPLSRHCAHLCVDMQRLFTDEGPWQTPWLEQVRPRVLQLVEAAPSRTLFTRFMPPFRPEQRPGRWVPYFIRWAEVTGERCDPTLVELLPELQAYVPPAVVIDKPAYSPFEQSRLDETLRARQIDTLVITGTETEQCILAGVLAAVDRGLRTIVVYDAVCSSSDVSHDAVLDMFARRFSHQIEVASTADITLQLKDLAS